MIELDEVRKVIEDDMKRLAKENNFNSLEQVRGHFRLIEKEFEVGTVLTPTQKIRRPKAREEYAQLIKEIYEDSERENL